MAVTTERRAFLKYLGAGFAGAAAQAAGPLGPIVHASGPMPFQRSNLAAAASTFLSFGPIAPTDRDDLVLPNGFRYLTVIAYGDRFTASDERFGFNADFTAFFPRNADGTEGLLAVNHEYVGTDTDTTDRRSPRWSAACRRWRTCGSTSASASCTSVSVVGRQLVRPSEQHAQPPHHRRLARHRRRAGAAGRVERRRHAGQLLGLPHAVEHAC